MQAGGPFIMQNCQEMENDQSRSVVEHWPTQQPPQQIIMQISRLETKVPKIHRKQKAQPAEEMRIQFVGGHLRNWRIWMVYLAHNPRLCAIYLRQNATTYVTIKAARTRRLLYNSFTTKPSFFPCQKSATRWRWRWKLRLTIVKWVNDKICPNRGSLIAKCKSKSGDGWWPFSSPSSESPPWQWSSHGPSIVFDCRNGN